MRKKNDHKHIHPKVYFWGLENLKPNRTSKQLEISDLILKDILDRITFSLNANTTSELKSDSMHIPRLLAAAKEFNLGKSDLVNFLTSKGFIVDANKPTAKLNKEMYYELIKQFKPEKLKDFENENQPDIILQESFISFSIYNGRIIVKKQNPDGSIVVSDGIETKFGFSTLILRLLIL